MGNLRKLRRSLEGKIKTPNYSHPKRFKRDYHERNYQQEKLRKHSGIPAAKYIQRSYSKITY